MGGLEAETIAEQHSLRHTKHHPNRTDRHGYQIYLALVIQCDPTQHKHAPCLALLLLQARVGHRTVPVSRGTITSGRPGSSGCLGTRTRRAGREVAPPYAGLPPGSRVAGVQAARRTSTRSRGIGAAPAPAQAHGRRSDLDTSYAARIVRLPRCTINCTARPARRGERRQQLVGCAALLPRRCAGHDGHLRSFLLALASLREASPCPGDTAVRQAAGSSSRRRPAIVKL
jgi:hypothetical protein